MPRHLFCGRATGSSWPTPFNRPKSDGPPLLPCLAHEAARLGAECATFRGRLFAAERAQAGCQPAAALRGLPASPAVREPFFATSAVSAADACLACGTVSHCRSQPSATAAASCSQPQHRVRALSGMPARGQAATPPPSPSPGRAASRGQAMALENRTALEEQLAAAEAKPQRGESVYAQRRTRTAEVPFYVRLA